MASSSLTARLIVDSTKTKNKTGGGIYILRLRMDPSRIQAGQDGENTRRKTIFEKLMTKLHVCGFGLRGKHRTHANRDPETWKV